MIFIETVELFRSVKNYHNISIAIQTLFMKIYEEESFHVNLGTSKC